MSSMINMQVICHSILSITFLQLLFLISYKSGNCNVNEELVRSVANK